MGLVGPRTCLSHSFLSSKDNVAARIFGINKLSTPRTRSSPLDPFGAPGHYCGMQDNRDEQELTIWTSVCSTAAAATPTHILDKNMKSHIIEEDQRQGHAQNQWGPPLPNRWDG